MEMRHNQTGLPAGKWQLLFKKACIEQERLEVAKSEKARTTILGNFLAQNVGREVPFEINGRTGRATLRVNIGRAKQKQYYFEVRWDESKVKSPNNPKRESLSKPSGPPPKTKSKTYNESGIKTPSAPKRREPLDAVRANDESWG